MKVEELISQGISWECEKLILRYQSYHNDLHIKWIRKKNFIDPQAKKLIKIPDYWDEDRKFNPFYVFKHRKAIAKSIAKKIVSGTYLPNTPYEKRIPKATGGERLISIYQIPDQAVSNLIYGQLLSKNKHRFSSFAYAYRDDRNAHYAIQDISLELKESARLFVAEFDFSDFFGSIDHNYLYEQFNKNGFSISRNERDIIQAFLKPRNKGVPQGTSISLFLANLACWELDKNLEKNGLKFARYADDTVVWSTDYTKICQAVDIIYDFSKQSGIKINLKKSDGVSIVAKKGFPSEFKPKVNGFDFLGYTISPEKVSIKKKAVDRIKGRISYILYSTLIQPISRTPFRSIKIPANNMDHALLSAIHMIRRFLYGALSEKYLAALLRGRIKQIRFKGIMSYYPFVDDIEQLKGLDGWLVDSIFNTVRKRLQILSCHKFRLTQKFPFNVPRPNLVFGFKKKVVKKTRPYTIPSFLRVYQAIQKGIINIGIPILLSSSSSYNYATI
ncbi:MAG: RNA-dependent DNA polymerase [Candidatus Riflebacteria bacterium]|nr:RNA-dependent DNA polymerase [Candidatus Riflebacteria bacterium]